MDDLINRQAAIDAVEESRRLNHHQDGKAACAHEYEHRHFLKILSELPSAQPESIRTFVELVVRYQDPELCTYKEYKGKPYYSIKYIENGETYVGYGTYNPGVLSQYLKEYFMPSAQPDRKKGRWIKTYRNGFGNLIGYCNQCGRSASVDNYCPNCGANMRGDEA